MSKPIKISIIVVFFLAVIAILFNPLGWNMPWDEGKTETAISTQDSAEKARADAAEAENKKLLEEKAAAEKKLKEIIAEVDQMIADAKANNASANQIASPVPTNPADTATVVIPVKKKSGVGG